MAFAAHREVQALVHCQRTCSCLRGAMVWSLKPADSLLDVYSYA